MAERFRLFRGTTELNYSEASIEFTNDSIVNQGKANIEAEPTVVTASTIEFRKADGSTVVFAPKVRDIKRPDLWELLLLSNGWELMNVWVETVYSNKSPEFIVEDIITNYTQTLTYASTYVSGITITDNYVAKGYAIDIIRDMMTVTGAKARIDVNDNFYFDSTGYIDNGRTLADDGTGDTDAYFADWGEDSTQIVNHCKLLGGVEGRSTVEALSGTNTTWTLSYKPSGSVRITVGGVEQSPSVIVSINSENKTVTTSSLTDPTFYYDYNRPVVVDDQDDVSVNLYGEIFQQVDAPFISSASDGRKFTRGYLEVQGYPKTLAVAFINDFDFSFSVNERVRCVNSIRNHDEFLVINKILYEAQTGRTILTLGSRPFDGFDKMRNVDDEIKKIKRKFTNDSDTIFSRTVRAKYEIQLSRTITFEYNSPEDSFIPGSGSTRPPTLCFPRATLADEPDCTNNGNTGTWSGTGVTSGSQYSTSGKRLSCAVCDGSTSSRYCTSISTPFVADAPVLSISVWAKWNNFSADQVLWSRVTGDTTYPRLKYVQSTNQLRLEYLLDGVLKTLNVSSFSGLASTGTWYLVTVVLDHSVGASIYLDTTTAGAAVGSDANVGTDYDHGVNALRVACDATPGSYFNGNLDEFIIFNTALSAADRTKIIAKHLTGVSGLDTSMVLWYAFDNPTPGDKSTARVAVP